MTDFFLRNNRENGLDPEKVRILEIKVEPWEDKRRLRIFVKLTPFKQSPSMEFILKDNSGKLISEASIIETDEDQFVFTMHIRSLEHTSPYHLFCNLTYGEDIGIIHTKELTFSI